MSYGLNTLFFFLLMLIQLSYNLFFLHQITFTSLSKISYLYMCKSVSGLLVLVHWPVYLFGFQCHIFDYCNFLVSLEIKYNYPTGTILSQSCFSSSQFSSVAQSCPTLCDRMNRSTPGLPVHHQLPEFTQTHVHRLSDAIQPSHPLSSPSHPAPNPSQHQGLFQWVNSSHEVAKVLEFQL